MTSFRAKRVPRHLYIKVTVADCDTVLSLAKGGHDAVSISRLLTTSRRTVTIRDVNRICEDLGVALHSRAAS